jgi:uncharacterized membrane protein
MTTFTVWKFDDPDGAARAEEMLKGAAKDGLVKIVDHAVVSWPADAGKPEVHSGTDDDVVRKGGWGAFWGLIVGTLFFAPLLGAAAGAALGALSAATEKTGITKDQLERIRAEITPGTSALFAVTDSGDLDRLAERFHGMHSRLVDSNLTDVERKVLLDTFGG